MKMDADTLELKCLPFETDDGLLFLLLSERKLQADCRVLCVKGGAPICDIRYFGELFPREEVEAIFQEAAEEWLRDRLC